MTEIVLFIKEKLSKWQIWQNITKFHILSIIDVDKHWDAFVIDIDKLSLSVYTIDRIQNFAIVYKYFSLFTIFEKVHKNTTNMTPKYLS